MAAKQDDKAHILLEEEVSNLKEELAQCQADKEFVWSLWKRLQVANPDLTQAISLVVEREKHKAEAKDRKVLEILQVKDDKLRELEERASGQQQELNNLVQRKIAVDEENAFLKNELSDLQWKFKDKSREFKDIKEYIQKKEEQTRLLIRNLENGKESLNVRCADLLNDLEKLRKEKTEWKEERSGTDAKIKHLETSLTEAKRQMEDFHSKLNELLSQLDFKQTELTEKEVDATRLRKELQEMQNLYKQSNEHAVQQAELIQQLQALNMDTQKVLRNQEDAHTAETISYQKLYNDLNMCYETLKSSEAQLRQGHISLTDQVLQKEQHISQLQGNLQKALDALHQSPQTADSEHLKQECQQSSFVDLELMIDSQKSEIKLLQEKLKLANLKIQEINAFNGDMFVPRAGKGQEEPPVKRSRSLSPKSSFRESEEQRKLKIAERKNEHLEKTVQLKIQENVELKKAHENRKERLQMLQTNYRTVKQQLKQLEEGCIRVKSNKGQHQRAEPWQLRQEDSDAVWNELAFFKKEHKKLLIEKLNLEEELDQQKVVVSMDKATIQELNACLQQEREELLFRLGEDDGVRNSTPKKSVKETLDQTMQKVSHLERKLSNVERESVKLKEENEELAKDKKSLRQSLKRLAKDSETKEQELEELLKKNQEAKNTIAELELMTDELKRDITSLKRQVAEANHLRNDNEWLLRQVQNLQLMLDEAKKVTAVSTGILNYGQCNCKTNKVKLKTTKKMNSLKCHQAFLNQSIKAMRNVFENFSKDGWEDMSEGSDSEITDPESLGELIVKASEGRDAILEGNTDDKIEQKVVISEERTPLQHMKNTQDKDMEQTTQQKKCDPPMIIHSLTNSKASREKKKSVVQRGSSLFSLRERINSLQQQVAVLQNGRRAAASSTKELKKSNSKLASELQLANQRLQISKQMAQKVTSDLAQCEHEKEDLERAADQMREQLTKVTESIEGLFPMSSNQIQPAVPAPSKNIDLELKQIQYKLKNAMNEIIKQTSTIKSLKNEAQEKDERNREMQEKVIRMERDINMKRHLIDDLKSRLKVHQENDKSSKEMLENLEKKVKALTEDSFNKKTSIDSLKQRLNVATKEKSQYEQMYCKAKKDLEKEMLRVTDLESKITEAESAMTEFETTASQQLHGLAMQSGQALEGIQKKLLLANNIVDEFVTFVKALATGIQRDIHAIRMEIKQAKKIKECSEGLSKECVHRAQSLAASILNISKTDLEEILDVENEEENEKTKVALEHDKEWLGHILKILEAEFPFASCLMEAMLEKLNQKRKLVEEYTLLMKDTR
ncbi:centlein [Rhinatrema bivittatum]|uniref:centlein n=1 Tax=Rhinatrema bivittatum TaxID=194408 RepID=UPI0011267806|nr:centlein [Rhinatrema bivittatum]XP_029464547.1 centlein [Rhinatrema bivittatum]XP_029464556.1 centlein [Rhinatrema bivittatum]